MSGTTTIKVHDRVTLTRQHQEHGQVHEPGTRGVVLDVKDGGTELTLEVLHRNCRWDGGDCTHVLTVPSDAVACEPVGRV